MRINKKTSAVIIAIIIVSGLGWMGFRLASDGENSAAQTLTKQNTAKPIESLSASPAPSAFKTVVDDILEEGFASIRIFEGSISDYTDDETPYFSKPIERVMFFPNSLISLRPEVSSQLFDRIKIIAKDTERKIQFTVNPIESNDIPFSLQLIDAPLEDLLIHFAAIDGKEDKIITLVYTEPFNLTVTSEDDPGFASFDKQLKRGIYLVRHLEPGKLYKYRFQFTHEMNRESVQQKVTEYLTNNTFQGVSLEWLDDSSFMLLIDFRQVPETPLVGFDFSGVRNKAGYELSESKYYQFHAGPAQALYRIDLSTFKKTSLFVSSVHFSEIDVSPNGKYGLAAEVAANEMHDIYDYSAIDLKGEILKTFGLDEIHLVKWAQNGNVLIYLQNNSVMHYDLTNNESKVIWSAPNQDKNARIISLDLDPASETTVVGWGTHDDDGGFTYDLYILSSYSDNNPKKIKAAGSFSCYEGPCYNYGYRIIKNGEMYYEVYNGQEQNPERSAYKLNLVNGEKKEAELIQQIKDDNKRNFELSNGTTLLIQKKPEDDTEQWIQLDPTSGKQTPLMETSLGIFNSSMSFYEFGEGKYLIHLSEQNWQLIDTKNKKVTQYSGIPKEVNQVHKLGTELYYFSNVES